MKKYLIMSAFVILYLAVYFILQNHIGSMYLIFYMIKEFIRDPQALASNIDFLMNDFIQKSIWYIVIAAAISFPVYVFIMWLRKESIYKFCSFSKISAMNIALVSLMGIALNFVAEFLISLSNLGNLSPDTEKMFGIIFEGNSLGMILLGIGIIGPVIEEIIFRGLIFNELRRNIPVVWALIIQALLFGIYHMNPTQAIYASCLGIVLGLVFMWTKSIWAPILIHIFFNSTSTVLGKAADEQMLNSFQYPILIASVVILAVTLVLTWKGRKAGQLVSTEVA